MEMTKDYALEAAVGLGTVLLAAVWRNVKKVKYETQPNSGESMRDEIQSVASKVEELTKTKNASHAHMEAIGKSVGDIAERISELAMRVQSQDAILWLMADAPRSEYAMFVTDASGANVRTNESYSEMFGSDGMGNDWRQLVDQTGSPRYIDEFMAAIRNPGLTKWKYRGASLWVRGKVVECNVKVLISRRPDGAVENCYGIVYVAGTEYT